MTPVRSALSHRSRGLHEWLPSEGGPLGDAWRRQFQDAAVAAERESHFTVEPPIASKTNGHDSIFVREGELMSKLHDLIHSPIGDGVARIVDELHVLLAAVSEFD